MLETLTDNELVTRAQAGERQAFDVLYRRHTDTVRKAANRIVHDWRSTEDIAQQVWMSTYLAIHTFRRQSSFSTWIFSVATNVAKNHRASMSRRVIADAEPIEGDSPADVMPLLSPAPTPERTAIASEISRSIYSAITSLPIEVRTVVGLREIEGLSYRDMASVMDCPANTARSRLARARATIEEMLRPMIGQLV